MIPTKRTQVSINAMKHYVCHMKYTLDAMCPGTSVFPGDAQTHFCTFVQDQENGSLPSKIPWRMALEYLESLNKTGIEESLHWQLKEDGLHWYLSSKGW